jgi:[protein-PII] uridylyltransferase
LTITTPSTPLTRNRKKLFSAEQFTESLAESASKISCYREAVGNARKILDECFLQKNDIESIIKDEAWFVDQLLIHAWEQYDWKDADDISLIAVGGYGRAELHPYSDIDIQVLLTKSDKSKYKDDIEHFLTFLWDINLEIGQSVRSIKENQQEAAKDITVATSLIESRTLCGNPALLDTVMSQIEKKKVWQPKQFFQAKKDEQINRHRKQNDIDYALEPNLKEAPGGLRDIQTIGWISKRHFGATNFLDLVKRKFLEENEYQDLIKGRNFLWKIRYGLHMVSGRREDRLLFEHQRTLAEIFGYKDDKRSLGIEKLMKEYYRVVLTLRELNDVLLQLFDEEIIRSKERAKIVSINNRFQIRNNYIEVKNKNVFENTPFALIEIFALLAQNEKIAGIRAATIRLIRNNRHLIDNEYRRDIRNISMFMELLRSPHMMVGRLREMKRYGILSAYLPEFGRIIGQMQYDLFHVYTVDDHTLQVMENMRRFRHPEASEKFPVAAALFHRLPKVELLYIAGLYHDIAKGRGGDHSQLGKRDAELFCRRHRLGKWDTALVSWLVEHHLTMSSVAQREDIQDPEVVKKFALNVGDQTRLDYLYVLTVADINGTNSTLWNTWRASLLRNLYQLTKRALSQGLEETVGKAELIKENQKSAIALLESAGLTGKQVKDIWNNPSEDYFLRESPQDITWQTIAIANHKSNVAPLILIKNNTENKNEGATQIFIYTQNSHFLFANIATALDRLNLNIQDARIYTTDSDYSMTNFMVLESDGKPIGKNPQRMEEINKTLNNYVSSTKALKPTEKHRPSRKHRQFTHRTDTTLSNHEHTPYSILEVLCTDRPGLLAKVAGIFVEMDITLHTAKITTLGENVEDVFFITDPDNNPITDKIAGQKLQDEIKKNLDAEITP